MLHLNLREHEALLRQLDGVSELEGFDGITLSRRNSFDSLDRADERGFLILRVEFEDGSFYEDAISDVGSVSTWTRHKLRYWNSGAEKLAAKATGTPDEDRDPDWMNP